MAVMSCAAKAGKVSPAVQKEVKRAMKRGSALVAASMCKRMGERLDEAKGGVAKKKLRRNGGLANYAADLMMLHVLPERKHYRTYKQERTPDFSDLRNKIAEVEGEKKKLRDRKNRFAAKLDES